MTANDKKNKPWGGRFTLPTDEFVEHFTESVSYDQRLALVDLLGSIAHAQMLGHAGILKKKESETIVEGLKSIEDDVRAGTFNWDPALEDVHMNIESALTARIGEVGKKLHTARSRNDQVATDIRLYLRMEIQSVRRHLSDVMGELLVLAEDHTETIMPGFTHLQSAQPVTFAHHLMAWFEMLFRDSERLADCHTRVNVMPLGAGALAGTGFPIDRAYAAKLLDFPAISENSLDAVSDRDFAIEFSHCAAQIMMHLSRFSEELVLWMSQQFSFIELDDAWCTGSSIMPQKKNPDIPELIRGKTGRVYGHLMSLLTLMKGQPLAYNRDNQEDKLALFDVIDTVKQCLQAYRGIIPGIKVRADRMRNAANQGYATATDLADYLVIKEIPFREAHAIVGQTVQYAIEQDKDLSSLSLKELQQFSSAIADDVYDYLSLEGSISARDHIGGTAPSQVTQAIKRAHKRLSKVMVKDTEI